MTAALLALVPILGLAQHGGMGGGGGGGGNATRCIRPEEMGQQSEGALRGLGIGGSAPGTRESLPATTSTGALANVVLERLASVIQPFRSSVLPSGATFAM